MPPKERPRFILDRCLQDATIELEGEAYIGNLSPFEEFQKWAGTLGIQKGWVKG